MEIPKTIDGINTDKNASEQRRNLIRQTYIDLFNAYSRPKAERLFLMTFWVLTCISL